MVSGTFSRGRSCSVTYRLTAICNINMIINPISNRKKIVARICQLEPTITITFVGINLYYHKEAKKYKRIFRTPNHTEKILMKKTDNYQL